MSSNCLWHACRALFAGLLLLGVGTVMCISGKDVHLRERLMREELFRTEINHV